VHPAASLAFRARVGQSRVWTDPAAGIVGHTAIDGGDDGMPSKKTLNAKNLQDLGAERLAEILMEAGAGDAALKRRLRWELAAAASPEDLTREVRKRLTTLARSKGFIEWHHHKAFVSDLDAQRQAILRVSETDPAEALDLLWRFMALADATYRRCDDSNGAVGEVFRAACRDLGPVARAAAIAPTALAEQIRRALSENDYGQYDGLIETLAPALGPAGLGHLKDLVVAWSREPVARPPEAERVVVAWGRGGAMYADELAEHRRDGTIRLALAAIADAEGDVDAFMAQHGDKARRVPAVAVAFARRLLAAGRAEDALRALEAVEDRPGRVPFEWEEARIDVLEALGRPDEAQAFRWTCFERSLDPEHLRAYLKRLPDFEDLEAEERARSHALAYPNAHHGLMFLTAWPALDQAAALVLARAGEWDGDFYEILAPAAEALEARHPLAATILLRALIDFALDRGRSQRYRHAARHLQTCETLAPRVEDFGTTEPHDAYRARLKAVHGRKSGFWSLVP